MSEQKPLCLCDYPKEYSFDGIDLIKFICAYLVCMIHVPLFQGITSPFLDTLSFALKNGIARIAVPFFFSASGFLLFRKISIYSLDKVRIKKYCYKLLFLLGLWTTLLIVGFTDHLWYLSGLVIVSILFSALWSKKKSFKLIFIISGMLYLFGLFGDSYSCVLDRLFVEHGWNSLNGVLGVIYNQQTRAFILGVFFAFVFYSIGVFMAYRPIRISMVFAVVGFVISVSLLLFESFSISRIGESYDHNMYLSLIPTTFFLLYIATHLNLSSSTIYKKLRAVGVLIFFLHIMVYALIKNGIAVTNSAIGMDLSSFTFLIVVIIVTILAFFIECLSHKNRFGFLRILYS